jgi:hypothetical protein
MSSVRGNSTRSWATITPCIEECLSSKAHSSCERCGRLTAGWSFIVVNGILIDRVGACCGNAGSSATWESKVGGLDGRRP